MKPDARRPPRRTPLERQLFLGFAVALAVPMVGLGWFGSVRYLQTERAHVHDRIDEAAMAVRRQVNDYLTQHRTALYAFARGAEIIGAGSRAQLNVWLAQFHTAYPDFLSTIVLDREGAIVNAYPLVTTAGDSILAGDWSVADREHFRVVMATAEPHISGGFTGRGFGDDLVVALSVPVLGAEGIPVGVVEGSLDVRRFDIFGRDFAAMEQLGIVILDQNQRVVYSNRLEPLSTLVGATLRAEIARTRDGRFSYRALANEGSRAAVVRRVAVADWTVLVEQEDAVVVRETFGYIRLQLALSLLGLLLSLAIAFVLSRGITRPLARLATAVAQFDLEHEPDTLAAPRDAPSEMHQLFDGFREMMTRLRRQLSGLIPICAHCKRIRTEQGEWESVEAFVGSRSDADFSHGLCPPCEDRLQEEIARLPVP